MEAVSEADTVIFDKTGTLTQACPTVCEVAAFQGKDKRDMLRLAACPEEHFPHPVANAVVRAAQERGLDHREMHILRVTDQRSPIQRSLFYLDRGE